MKEVFVGLTLVLALAACGTQAPPALSQQPGAVVIKSHTKVLGTAPAPGVAPQRRQETPQDIPELISASPDLSTITFSGNSQYANDLQPGDVIAAPPNQVSRDGFLRKVNYVQDAGGQVRVSTEETDLDEAIDYANTDQSVDLTQGDITTVEYADGTKITGQQLNGRLRPQWDVTLGRVNVPFNDIEICTGDDGTKITANGALNASLKAFLNVHFNWLSLRQAETGIQADQSLNLRMSGQCKYNLFNVDYSIARINFATKVIWVGPVPVVITPYVSVNVGANGNITLAASFNITETYSGRYGVRWEKGSGFSAINETNFNVSGIDSIDANADLNLLGYVRAEAGFKFYGLAYLYAYAKPYLEWTGTYALPANTFNYTMYAGMKLGVGGRLRIFGKNLGEYNSPELDVGRTLIASH